MQLTWKLWRAVLVAVLAVVALSVTIAAHLTDEGISAPSTSTIRRLLGRCINIRRHDVPAAARKPDRGTAAESAPDSGDQHGGIRQRPFGSNHRN